MAKLMTVNGKNVHINASQILLIEQSSDGRGTRIELSNGTEVVTGTNLDTINQNLDNALLT